MKPAQLLAIGAILVTAVSGCTTAAPNTTAPLPTVAPSSSAPTPISQTSRVLTGTFVSQARTTRGEVVITEKPDSIVLTLKDFSTAPGDDLEIDWNPGAMTKNAAGDNVVEDPTMTLIAPLKSLTGTQSYDVPLMIRELREPHSITIYNYTTREAFGTANLHEE